MNRIAVTLLAVAAFSGAGLAAQADEFSLDLKKIDPSTPAGQTRIQEWKNDVAEAYCGPIDMPQPLDLQEYRARCQVAVKADAQTRIDAAIARKDAALKYNVVANR